MQITLDIGAISDQFNSVQFYLEKVYYIPGLNTRLFSIDAFTSQHPNYRVEFHSNSTIFHFCDDQSYTIKKNIKSNSKPIVLIFFLTV